MIKVLFVCLGNICRSPMAEFVFKDMIKKQGLENEFYIESAATSSEEIGNGMHYGTISKLKEMNIPFGNKKARKLTQKDYDKFDYILGMENSNIRNINRIVGEDSQNKVYRLLDFSKNPRDIADPWYTGNFDKTYQDVLEGCENFLQYIKGEKMNSNEIATKIYNMTEDNIYSIINQFDENQIVDKSLVYCFIKAFYIHTVKIYINIRKVSMDFEKLYLEYKESLITYYKTNNPNIENEVLDQILNFFDNSYGLIESIEFKSLDDSYEFRHYTINVFELLRMILEKKSKAPIRENIFDDYIKVMIQETEKILTYIGSIK